MRIEEILHVNNETWIDNLECVNVHDAGGMKRSPKGTEYQSVKLRDDHNYSIMATFWGHEELKNGDRVSIFGQGIKRSDYTNRDGKTTPQLSISNKAQITRIKAQPQPSSRESQAPGRSTQPTKQNQPVANSHIQRTPHALMSLYRYSFEFIDEYHGDKISDEAKAELAKALAVTCYIQGTLLDTPRPDTTEERQRKVDQGGYRAGADDESFDDLPF